MADSFAEVVIMGTALHKGLHYLVPPRFAGKVQPGSRVSVELGKRKATGVVVWVGDSPPDLPETITLRPILDTIDELPAIPPDLLQLCLWISSYYFYPLGEVFDLVIPFKGSEPIGSDLKSSKRKSARLIDRAASDSTGGQGGPSLRCGSPLHAGADPHFVAGLRYTQEFQAMRPVRARSFLRADWVTNREAFLAPVFWN
ncbi:MAG: hypothetical protein ABSG91_19885 [Syntrophobacteraceae bacterium]